MRLNYGVVPLVMLFSACATTSSNEFECGEVCEIIEECTDVETCEAELEQVGTEILCEEQTVSITQEVCSVYLDSVKKCDTSDIMYSDTVLAEAVFEFVTNECSSSLVNYADDLCMDVGYECEETECSSLIREVEDEVCESVSSVLSKEITFDDLTPGMWGDDISHAYDGVTFSVKTYRGYDSPTDLAIFDSLISPTGPDPDLGTASEYWGGLGVGSAGYYTNFFERGNLLIHAENLHDLDGDGLIDSPDDEARGATIIMEFDKEVCFEQVTLIDIESREAAFVTLYDSSGDVIMDQLVPGLGNNSVQIIDPKACGVTKAEVSMCGSGAIDDIHFSFEQEKEVCVPHSFETEECSSESEMVGYEKEVCSPFEYSCEETSCKEIVVSETVMTSTEHSYVCPETRCWDELQTVDVCETHTVEEVQEVCVEVPKVEAVMSCEIETECKEVEVCKESECAAEEEWLSGGGPVGTR